MLTRLLPQRLGRWLLIAVLCIAGIVCSCSSAFAQSDSTPIKVLNVHIGGYIDPHNESLISRTLTSAKKDGVTLYVLQLDSNGVAGGDVERLAKKFADTDFVTAIWVGPTSAVYSKELDPFVRAADFVGAADKKLARAADANIVAPSLREFYAQLDERSVKRIDYTLDMGCSRKEVENATRDDVCQDVSLRTNENFKLNIAPQFEKLSPIANLGHSLIAPGFALGLLVMGLCLLAFEFFAASVGVAAVAGILASLAGVYGLGYLPVHWFFVALVVLGVAALVIDVQAGGVGLYTMVGAILIFVGSLFSTARSGPYSIGFAPPIIITVMALLFAVGAIPSLIRTRFGTPTIGREDFIGEEGIAKGDIDPEGSVELRGGAWKARTNHATPIKDGQRCRVVSIEGIVLEVEPLVGAAVDYREKRRSSDNPDKR